jgi:hypothetical protein
MPVETKKDVDFVIDAIKKRKEYRRYNQNNKAKVKYEKINNPAASSGVFLEP